jgi:hypothetical protein
MRLGGKGVGKLGGAALGAMTANPFAAKAISYLTSKVLEHGAPIKTLINIETSSFLQQAEAMGVDQDLANKYSRYYGSGAGAIEYAQMLWLLKTLKAVPSPIKRSMLMGTLKLLGGNVWNGLEEASQQGIENHLINKMIDAHKLRAPFFMDNI